MIKKYYATAYMCAVQAFDGNFLCVTAEYAVRFLRLFIFILISLISSSFSVATAFVVNTNELATIKISETILEYFILIHAP